MADLALRNARGDEARVSIHGAQVLSWRVAGQGEQLYLAPGARPQAGKTLRGGVPVCFPQFSGRGPLVKHGFARLTTWEVIGSGAGEARLRLPQETGFAGWPHRLELELAVRLGDAMLEVELSARNAGGTAFEFTGALHTYFALQDLRNASLAGLQGCTYEDALDGNALKQEREPAVPFLPELDRVYRDAPSPLRLQEDGRPTRRIEQSGFRDAVVWNPGPDKAARLGDMPPEDWRKMVCVEAAAAAQPVPLAPGQAWTGRQRICLSP